MKKIVTFIFLLFAFFVHINYKSYCDDSMAQEIFQSIYKKIKSDLNLNYSINLEIIDDEAINAYASPDENSKGNFKVIITTGLLKNVVKDNRDGLALIIGHEIAHITQNHLELLTKEFTNYKKMIFTRNNEFDADTVGMKYALQSGYSITKGIEIIKNLISMNLNYSSFEGVGSDHPSWSERLEYIDKEKSKLWRSMSAFENGVFFLEIEHYIPAEYCFRAVIKEFPNCYEAYANLGYSLLMQYCDCLDKNVLEKYNIGMILTGSFVKRPMSLSSQVRGINEELWWDAVGNLKEALRIKPDLPVTNANLGLAYLLHPAGKDLKNATRYFDNAIKFIEQDTLLDNLSKSIIYINAGVSFLADGELNDSKKQFEYADQLSSLYFTSLPRKKNVSLKNISACISYNKAFLMSKENHPDSVRIKNHLEYFLLNSSKNTIWWEIGKEKYLKLCQQLKIIPSKKIDLKNDYAFKPVVGLKIKNYGFFAISDLTDNIFKNIPEQSLITTTVTGGTNLKKIFLEEDQLEFLVSDRILSIFLKGESSPPINLETKSLAGQKFNLYVGMSIEQFEIIIGDEKDNYIFEKILSNTSNYRFYFNLGLAVKINKKENKVSEIVIIQIPYY